MRARLAILPVLLVAVVALMPTGVANASSGHPTTVAQAESGDEANTDPAAEETGPLWTYQMARISLAMLLVLFMGAGLWYYRLVVKRQRGEI